MVSISFLALGFILAGSFGLEKAPQGPALDVSSPSLGDEQEGHSTRDVSGNVEAPQRQAGAVLDPSGVAEGEGRVDGLAPEGLPPALNLAIQEDQKGTDTSGREEAGNKGNGAERTLQTVPAHLDCGVSLRRGRRARVRSCSAAFDLFTSCFDFQHVSCV